MKRIVTIVALICAMIFQVNAQTTEFKNLNFAPLLQWGCSIADVEQHIKSKEWWQDGNDKLEYWEDPFQSWHKWYWVDAENQITEQYLFETEDGQNLRYTYCICWDNTVPADEFVLTLYHQGFQYTGEMVEFDGEILERYLSADWKTEALYSTDEEGYSQAIYRPVESNQPVTEFPYSQDFENGPGGWTVIDANNDSLIWQPWRTSSYVTAHSSGRFAASLSWIGGGVQADEYLISPAILLPTDKTVTLSWWFCVNPEYPEDKFAVMLSTTGNAAADFTATLIDISPTAEQGDWTQQTLDLSAYAGQSIWLAFYHYGYDNNYIALDDILITVSNPTGIQSLTAEDVNSKSSNSKWFDLQGRRLAAKPARRGLYIQGNKKTYINVSSMKYNCLNIW